MLDNALAFDVLALSEYFTAFWDPVAVKDVFATSIPFHMIALDITNNVPVTSAFMQAFSKHRREYPLYDFAGLCYSLVAFRYIHCSHDAVF